MSDIEDLPALKRMKIDTESSKDDNKTPKSHGSNTYPSKLNEDDQNMPKISEHVFLMPKSVSDTIGKQKFGKRNTKIPVAIEDDKRSDSTIGKKADSDSKMDIDEKFQDSVNQNKYVNQEEFQKLHEFQVLDEVNEDDKDEDSDASDKSETIPDDEIEKMLDEDLPEGYKGVPKPKEKPYVTRDKIVLEEKGINQFEVLPLDWMMVRHCSGMPVYMHRGTRVCTLAKPYFLGKGNTRRHDIPLSAIPCLAYRKALEEEEKQNEIDKDIAEQIATGSWAKDQTNDQTTSKENAEVKKSYENQQAEKSDKMITETDEASTDNVKNGAELAHLSDTNQQTNDKYQTESNSSEDKIPEENSNNITETQSGDSSKDVPTNLNSNEGTDSGNNDPSSETNKDGCPVKSNAAKPVVLPGGIVMHPPRVETVNTSWKTQHLSAEQINDYCKNLFKFKNVQIMHFKRWADRRKYVKARKTLQYPTLPEGTKLITIPAQPGGSDSAGKATKRDWVMNLNGCSYLSVFHEYVRRALHKQPVYEFKQLENAATPYQATVYIGRMQYGVGHGSSKRAAKSAAARASILILIPEMKDELDEHAKQSTSKDGNNSGEPDFSFFDYVGIEDPRITEFCVATSEPSPHAILRTCLLRNFGAGDRHINTELKKLEFQKVEMKMTVGKHSATVVCKNKKQAKQRASQAILQALHPHIKSWGSLLRLYGSRSVKSCKEKKLEEQQITLLQDKAQQNQPNYAVLEKLRNEMRKLKERDEAVVPIGTLLVAENLPTHSGSMLNNMDL